MPRTTWPGCFDYRGRAGPGDRPRAPDRGDRLPRSPRHPDHPGRRAGRARRSRAWSAWSPSTSTTSDGGRVTTRSSAGHEHGASPLPRGRRPRPTTGSIQLIRVEKILPEGAPRRALRPDGGGPMSGPPERRSNGSWPSGSGSTPRSVGSEPDRPRGRRPGCRRSACATRDEYERAPGRLGRGVPGADRGGGRPRELVLPRRPAVRRSSATTSVRGWLVDPARPPLPVLSLPCAGGRSPTRSR